MHVERGVYAIGFGRRVGAPYQHLGVFRQTGPGVASLFFYSFFIVSSVADVCMTVECVMWTS